MYKERDQRMCIEYGDNCIQADKIARERIPSRIQTQYTNTRVLTLYTHNTDALKQTNSKRANPHSQQDHRAVGMPDSRGKAGVLPMKSMDDVQKTLQVYTYMYVCIHVCIYICFFPICFFGSEQCVFWLLFVCCDRNRGVVAVQICLVFGVSMCAKIRVSSVGLQLCVSVCVDIYT